MINDMKNVSSENSEEQTMNNVGGVLTSTSSGIGDNVSQIKDIARNYYSAVRTRTPIEPELRYDNFPSFSTLPKLLEMDYSRILNKPYFINNFDWNTTNPKGFFNNLSIPEALWVNPLARLPFEASTYYRAKISLILQVSGTPMHAGTVLVSAIPYKTGSVVTFPSLMVNTFMAAPHVFLSANESTPVILEVPFYVNTKLAAIDTDNRTVAPGNTRGNYADIFMYILNPLMAPTSGSTNLTISVHVVFRELEFYNPHITPTWTPLVPTPPLLDFQAEGFVSSLKSFGTTTLDNIFNGVKVFSGDFLDRTKQLANEGLGNVRDFIRMHTGLHAPEIPFIRNRMAITSKQNVNLVDAPSFFEKMDPYSQFTRLVNDTVFDTTIDEMSVKEIVSKPQFLGTFSVSTTDAAGSLLWSRPITPLQNFVQTVGFENASVAGVPSTCYGSTLIQTLSLLSKYWKGSIKIHIQSVMSNFHFCKLIIARNYSPDARMDTNYPTYNQITNLQTETLEFSAGGQVQTVELPFLSLMEQLPVTTDFEMNALEHGMYYIYLYQPLVTNGTVPTDVKFNVYISGGDDFELMGYATLPLLSYADYLTTPTTKSAVVSGIFEAEATSAIPVNSQSELMLHSNESETNFKGDFTPILNVRDYIRRFTKVYAERYTNAGLVSTEGLVAFPLSAFLKTRCRNIDTNSATTYGFYSNPLEIISSLFLGSVGGLKFKILINGTSIAEAWYVPPGCSIRGRRWASTLPIADGSGLGDILREQYKFPDVVIDPSLFPIPKFANPTVTIERPSMHINQPNYVLSTGVVGSDTETTSMTSTMLELEIPYMSPLRFVGNGSKNTVCNPISPINFDFAGDLGHLVIKVAVPNATNYTITNPHGVTIEVYVAATDEFRLGYQVFSPAVGVGAVVEGANSRQVTPYVLSVGNVTPNSVINSGANQFPACYYTKTT